LLGAPSLGAQESLGLILLGEGKRAVQTDTAAAETEVDQEEIDDRQASTIAQLTDSVPGVTLVNGSTPQGSGINIRGFGANGTYGTDQKVLILIDGATSGAEELYRIGTQLFTDPALYKTVTVNRGTVGSFEYGSGVIGGMVRLETKDASDFTGGEPGFAFHQTLQYASNGDGLTTSSTLAWQPTQELEFLANYTYQSQGDLVDGDGATIGNSSYDLPSYLLKAAYTRGDHRLAFSYADTTAADRDVPYDTFQTTGGAFGNVDRDTRSQTATLRYTFNPMSPLVNLDVLLSYANQDIDSAPASGQTGFLAAVVDADHRYQTTKLTAKNTLRFDTGAVAHDLRLGVERIRKERLNAVAAPGGVDNRWAVFAVNDMRLGALELTPALRYERSIIQGSTAPNAGRFENEALMGGLSAKYTFASGLSVFGSAAYTESLPILDDLGNATFMTQPERARSYELGVSYDSGAGLAAKLNAYQTYVWDITSTDAADRVEIAGIEAELSYAAANGVYVDLNANMLARADAMLGGAVTDWVNAPADTVQITLGRKFDSAWGSWDASWEVVAAAARAVNGASDPGYTVHNARVTWRPEAGVLEGTELRLGVENLLDATYTPALSTRTAPGRNVKLTLMKSF
jgi:hemoglobin/transferrin/lactoferrin receptor protein